MMRNDLLEFKSFNLSHTVCAFLKGTAMVTGSALVREHNINVQLIVNNMYNIICNIIMSADNIAHGKHMQREQNRTNNTIVLRGKLRHTTVK